MAHRDYKDSEPRRATRSSGKRHKGGLLKSLLLGLVLSLFIAGVLLWFLWPRAQDFKKAVSAPHLPSLANTPAPPLAPVSAAKKDAATKDDAAQNYTFYDILPGNQPPKPLPASKGRALWWLQIAALKNASDADTLRAKLTLLNFSAIVQPTPAGEPLLYRVRVGPYQDQAAANAAQKSLAENKIEAKALKEAITP